MKRFQNDNQFETKKPWLGSLAFKIAMLLGVFVLFFIGYKYSEEAYKQKQINSDIVELEDEIERLNQDNESLEELISYFQTEEFKEKETKDKLNIIKEGEKLVLIKEQEISIETIKEEKGAEVEVKRPNYYYWWHYFFGIKKG